MISAILSCFDKVPDFDLDATQLKRIILHALETLHGQVANCIIYPSCDDMTV